MDMKAAGAYISRMLGFTGCNFEIIKTKLSKESLDLCSVTHSYHSLMSLKLEYIQIRAMRSVESNDYD